MTSPFYEATRKRMNDLGFNAGLKASARLSLAKDPGEVRDHIRDAAQPRDPVRRRAGTPTSTTWTKHTYNFIAGEIRVHNRANPNIQQIPYRGGVPPLLLSPRGHTVIADYFR